MDYKGTKTEQNLLAAFAGESQARNKYTYYASRARKDGYEQIAAIFEATANNEKEHAKMWFKELGGIGDTAANLADAAAGENYEHEKMYPEFAKIAEAEGFASIATLFRMIAKAEVNHEKRYRLFVKKLAIGFFKSDDDETEWECTACGYIAVGEQAPKFCPVCGKPLAFFREAIDYD